MKGKASAKVASAKSEEDYKWLNVRISKDLYMRIKCAAAMRTTSLRTLINTVLDEHFKNFFKVTD